MSTIYLARKDDFFTVYLFFEGQLKSLWANQDNLMECGQMRFIFQRGSPCSPHTSSIGVAVFGSHWRFKKYHEQRI